VVNESLRRHETVSLPCTCICLLRQAIPEPKACPLELVISGDSVFARDKLRAASVQSDFHSNAAVKRRTSTVRMGFYFRRFVQSRLQMGVVSVAIDGTTHSTHKMSPFNNLHHILLSPHN
jgi:hypothetical protein